MIAVTGNISTTPILDLPINPEQDKDYNIHNSKWQGSATARALAGTKFQI